MRLSTSLVLGMLTTISAACATSQTEIPEAGSAGCDAAKVQHLIGTSADGDLAAKAVHLSGASSMRWLRPGQIVTMEYRADRLNMQLDDQNKVVAARCG